LNGLSLWPSDPETGRCFRIELKKYRLHFRNHHFLFLYEFLQGAYVAIPFNGQSEIGDHRIAREYIAAPQLCSIDATLFISV
jgi:hypothetical protein